MDENTIFTPPQKNDTLSPVQQAQSQQAPAPATPPHPDDYAPSFIDHFLSLPFGGIFKVVLGFLVLAVFVFGITRFVIPALFSKKAENVTLAYWGLWEDKGVMQAIIGDFEKENPQIKIEYSKQDPKQYRERLTTRVQNGNGPDVFRFHNTWLLQLSDILAPIPKDTIDTKEFQKSFYPVSQTDLARNGALYGVPLEIDTLALFINPEIFQAAGAIVPTTWDDFLQTARRLTVKDENGKIKTAGAAMGTFDNITHAPDILSMLFAQNGVDLFNFSSTSQNASDALDFYTSFTKGDGNVWDDTLDSSMLSFAKGNLAMYFGYSWDIFNIKALSPSFSFQIGPVPHLPKRSMTIASYWAEGVSVKSKHQKEALLFLKFLAKKETEQKLFSEQSKTRSFGEPYARVDLANLVKDNQLVYPFVSQAPDAVSSFFASDTEDNGLNSQMNAYLGNAVRSILGNTSPQSAVETLSQGISQVLKQYGK